jgi:hypothetical protein
LSRGRHVAGDGAIEENLQILSIRDDQAGRPWAGVGRKHTDLAGEIDAEDCVVVRLFGLAPA